jgi:potassium efflux system protein
MQRPVSKLAALALIALGGAMLVSSTAAAQQAAENAGVANWVIESRLEEVEDDEELSEETRTLLVGLYRKALGYIEAARASSAAADAFLLAREAAPEQTNNARDQLEAMQADSDAFAPDLPAEASARDLDRAIDQLRTSNAAASAKLSEFEQQLSAEVNRPGVARQRIVKVTALAEGLSRELRLPAPAGELPLIREARSWIAKTHLAELAAETRMLEEELASRPMRMNLLRAERDTVALSVRRMEQRFELLEARLREKRRSETERLIAEASDAAMVEGLERPLLAELIQRNRDLSEELTALNDSLAQTEAAAVASTGKRKQIQNSFQSAKKRVGVAGLSQTLGQILHEQRRDLPDLSRYQRQRSEREETVTRAGLRDIKLESELHDSQDLSSFVQGLLADLTAAEREGLEEPVRKLVNIRRALLERTTKSNTKYLRALGELDFEESQLMATASEFDAYLAERLLWVRSRDAVGLDSLAALPGEAIVLFDPHPWVEAVKLLGRRLVSSPLPGLALLIALPLMLFSSRLRASLLETGVQAGDPITSSLTGTLQALAYTLVLGLPWPILSLAIGFELSRALEASEEVKAIGHALMEITPALFFVRTLRAVCVPGGLAEAHFKWSEANVIAQRRQLLELSLTFFIPAFIAMYAYHRSPSDYGGEIGRFTFLISSLGLARFIIEVLRPGHSIVEELQHSAGEETRRLRWFVLLLVSAIPIGLFVAAFAGYLYSATTLMDNVIASLWLAWALVMTHALVERWLLLMKQRAWVRALKESQEADRLAVEKQGEAAGEVAPIPTEEPLDMASVDSDTRKLLNVALAIVAFLFMSAIWSSVLPALALLRQVILWESIADVGGETKVTVVTLADFGMALFYAFTTLIAARSLPSLVEAVLRQRGKADAGSRLAYATLARYLIVILGVALVGASVGFNWSTIQWLVAALGVGIGFGLQDIVANFISGLIILIERPIRVGDIVTVGDVTGVVSRLRIRATTVTTWDRQELLVPNREFVATRVLNWSLTDEISRMVMKVGVEYGSDLRKTMELIQQTIEKDERVLADPRPLITFDEFADNSLNITARAFVGSLGVRLEVMSDLNLAINETLTEAGIVVAFPQRDVHLDSASTLDVRVTHERVEESK